MHVLARQAAASGALTLPFPLAPPATGSIEKASAKGVSLAAKSARSAAAQFPELLEGLVEAADQANPQSLCKEDGSRAAFWLTANALSGTATPPTSLPIPAETDANASGEEAPVSEGLLGEDATPAATATPTAAAGARKSVAQFGLPASAAPAPVIPLHNTASGSVTPDVSHEPLTVAPQPEAAQGGTPIAESGAPPSLLRGRRESWPSAASNMTARSSVPTVSDQPVQVAPAVWTAAGRPANSSGKAPENTVAAPETTRSSPMVPAALASGAFPSRLTPPAAGGAATAGGPTPNDALQKACPPDESSATPAALQWTSSDDVNPPPASETSRVAPQATGIPVRTQLRAEPRVTAETARAALFADATPAASGAPEPAKSIGAVPSAVRSWPRAAAQPSDVAKSLLVVSSNHAARPGEPAKESPVTGRAGDVTQEWPLVEASGVTSSDAGKVSGASVPPSTPKGADWNTAPAAELPVDTRPLHLAATARMAAGETSAIQSPTSLRRQTGKPGTPRPKSPQKPEVRNQAASEPAEETRDPWQFLPTPAGAAPTVVSGSLSSAAQPQTVPPQQVPEAPQTRPAATEHAPAPSVDPARVMPQSVAAATPSSTDPEPAPAPASHFTNGNQEGQPWKVAFTATLKPADGGTENSLPAVDPPERPHSVPAASRVHIAEPETPEVLTSAAPAASDDTARPAATSSRPVPAAREKQLDAESERWRKPQENSGSDSISASASRLSSRVLPTSDGAPAAESGSTESSALSDAPAQAARPQIEPAADPVKTTAAHDIKLQVGGEGDRRVEVTVTERGGDVHVAVRTPDTRLAGELRQDLPALTTRLEQSGFHAETWHPAAAVERQHLADPQAGAAAQDPQSQSRQNGRDQQRDPQQQKQRDPDDPGNPSQRKKQGKDFEWLLSSLQ